LFSSVKKDSTELKNTIEEIFNPELPTPGRSGPRCVTNLCDSQISYHMRMKKNFEKNEATSKNKIDAICREANNSSAPELTDAQIRAIADEKFLHSSWQRSVAEEQKEISKLQESRVKYWQCFNDIQNKNVLINERLDFLEEWFKNI
jgi:hypothetical protein